MNISPGIYRHFKGGIYEVIGTATHSETMETMVVYKSKKDDSLWVRPLAMWNEIIERDGVKMTRFTKIE